MNLIIVFVICIIVLVAVILLLCSYQYSEEGFSSLRKTRATIIPSARSTIHKRKPLFLQNFQDYLINTTTDPSVGKKLLFRISGGQIKLIQNQHYLQLMPMHLGKHFYVLGQEKSRARAKRKWYFKKRGKGDQYYLYQKMGKKRKRIYLYIDNDVVTGSAKKKTAFRIEQKQLEDV
jgi:hypothetical protein